MKRLCIFALLSLLCAASAWGQPKFELQRIEAPPLPEAIPLYTPGEIPAGTVTERWGVLSGEISPGVRLESQIVRNVTWPTITPVVPEVGAANGLGVIVAPGGGFQSLSMDSEGFEIAERLAEQGITAFVLKYRLNQTPDDEAEFMRHLGKIMASVASPHEESPVREPRACADAQQALRLIRDRADEWHLDPERIGIIGFSAGARTALQVVLSGKPDEQPNFLGYIYGPMLEVDVPPHAPPMFNAFALDDGLLAWQGLGLVEAWRKAGIPVELHAYERGGHGFGAGRAGTTSAMMLEQFVAWLEGR